MNKIRWYGGVMLRAMILRNTGTLGQKRVMESSDEFDYEGGRYYIQKDAIFLKKGLFFYRPHLFYIEGYSLPVDKDKTERIEITVKPLSGGVKIIHEDVYPLIDAKSIHELTDKSLLDVLSGSIEKFEIFVLIMLFIVIVLSIVGIVR